MVSYADLRNMTEVELVKQHDQHASNTGFGAAWYRDELVRRDGEKVNRSMVRLTWVIAGLTVVNTAFVVLVALR